MLNLYLWPPFFGLFRLVILSSLKCISFFLLTQTHLNKQPHSSHHRHQPQSPQKPRFPPQLPSPRSGGVLAVSVSVSVSVPISISTTSRRLHEPARLGIAVQLLQHVNLARGVGRKPDPPFAVDRQPHGAEAPIRALGVVLVGDDVVERAGAARGGQGFAGDGVEIDRRDTIPDRR